MTFRDIVKVLSEKEHISSKEIQREMQTAIRCAGLTCSPQELIESVVAFVTKEDYIS